VIVGTDRLEVLNRIQSAFAREFEEYGKLEESDIRPMDYKLNKHGQGLESTLSIRIMFKKSPGCSCLLKTVISSIYCRTGLRLQGTLIPLD